MALAQEASIMIGTPSSSSQSSPPAASQPQPSYGASHRNSATVGAMYGEARGHDMVVAAVFGGSTYGRQGIDGSRNDYGRGHGRLEIGTGFGFIGSHVGGTNLVPHSPLLIGIEPLNMHMSLNTNGSREDYFEWHPSLAIGAQIPLGSCRLTPVARGGAAFGTLGSEGVRPLIGAGLYFNCPRIDFAADGTRVFTGDRSVNIAAIDADVRVSDNVSVGVRGETIQTLTNHDGSSRALGDSPSDSQHDQSENRGLLTVSYEWDRSSPRQGVGSQ